MKAGCDPACFFIISLKEGICLEDRIVIPAAPAGSLGRIVLLNGVPRAGKSSIAAVIQDQFEGVWLNLGVDRYMSMTPKKLLPGIGLRPGGERPDLEPMVRDMYLALYGSIGVHSRMGLNVVADVGHHDSYAQLDSLFSQCLALLQGLPVTVVGVECPLEVLLDRREQSGYPARGEDGQALPPIRRWQETIHRGKHYDLVVDTSRLTSEQCAQRIHRAVYGGE